MKRSIVFSFLLVMLANNLFASAAEINLIKDPDKPGPKPLSLTFLPVSATISETELTVYFDSVIGYATISVYDNNDNLVTVETVDTNSTSEVFISTDAWSSGSYKIKVSYGTTTLTGIFLIE